MANNSKERYRKIMTPLTEKMHDRMVCGMVSCYIIKVIVKLSQANFGFPMTLVSDSGPAFRNRFEEECAKLGVHVEENSAYNPSSYLGLKARWAV